MQPSLIENYISSTQQMELRRERETSLGDSGNPGLRRPNGKRKKGFVNYICCSPLVLNLFRVILLIGRIKTATATALNLDEFSSCSRLISYFFHSVLSFPFLFPFPIRLCFYLTFFYFLLFLIPTFIFATFYCFICYFFIWYFFICSLFIIDFFICYFSWRP